MGKAGKRRRSGRHKVRKPLVLYVLHALPTLGGRGDGTFLIHTDHDDGEHMPEGLGRWPSDHQRRRWNKRIDLARVMTHKAGKRLIDLLGDGAPDGLHLVPARLFKGVPEHEPQCGGECGGLFRCTRCRRFVGWCLGGADDQPTWCNRCWVDDISVIEQAAPIGPKGTKAKRATT